MKGKAKISINFYKHCTFTDDKAQVGSGYLRQCESLLIAQKKIEILMAAHNSINPNFPYTNCELDGSYGAVQQDGNQYVNRPTTVIRNSN
jgi:hypothetical protein